MALLEMADKNPAKDTSQCLQNSSFLSHEVAFCSVLAMAKMHKFMIILEALACAVPAASSVAHRDPARLLAASIDPRQHYYLPPESTPTPTYGPRVERPQKRQVSKLPTPTHNAQGALLCAPGAPCIDGGSVFPVSEAQTMH